MVATSSAAHRQHSVAMATMLALGVGHEATLVVAHQLLRNPLGLHALPSVAVQWHHDVDQLITAAIDTPPHRGWQASRHSGAPVPSPAHSRSPTKH
jgi:hypothetical protein